MEAIYKARGWTWHEGMRIWLDETGRGATQCLICGDWCKSKDLGRCPLGLLCLAKCHGPALAAVGGEWPACRCKTLGKVCKNFNTGVRFIRSKTIHAYNRDGTLKPSTYKPTPNAMCVRCGHMGRCHD